MLHPLGREWAEREPIPGGEAGAAGRSPRYPIQAMGFFSAQKTDFQAVIWALQDSSFTPLTSFQMVPVFGERCPVLKLYTVHTDQRDLYIYLMLLSVAL